MTKIIPIKDLRDTNKISEWCHSHNEPLFVTKNGYEDLVVLAPSTYDSLRFHEEKPLAVKRTNHDLDQLSLIDDFMGYIRVGSCSFEMKVGNVNYHVEQIKKYVKEAAEKEIKVLCFGELSLTGYSCRDLFFDNDLINQAEKGIIDLKDFSKNYDVLFAVGTPLMKDGKLYNCAVLIFQGEILAIYAKRHLASRQEDDERRQFNPWCGDNSSLLIGGRKVIFGNRFILQNVNHYKMCLGVEIGDDLWAVNTPSSEQAKGGANIILNLSSSSEIVGKEERRRSLIQTTSLRLVTSYIYASNGVSESTSESLFSGYKVICENGEILSKGELFYDGLIYNDIDINLLENERMNNDSFLHENQNNLDLIPFKMNLKNKDIIRKIKQFPFIYSENEYKKIIKMQAYSLKKRLESSGVNKIVIGVSGGMDSTLALIVCKETMEMMHLNLSHIIAVILPCFATSERTKRNAISLCESLKINYRIIDITSAIEGHLKDINHELSNKDITYENAQARERTQVLFDLANQENALVVGTGDLSEICLGWATYNGDHMASYCANASIPKTLVKELLLYYASIDAICHDVINDILLTPISPELVKNGEKIEQLTEAQIGPYELNDFFIYYYLRCHFSLKKILYLATVSFQTKYREEEIKSHLRNFVTRFYRNQFKRNTIPEGVKICDVPLSPRGDLRLDSDLNFESLLEEID